jgi:methionine synthase I (cobalamin-dependent)
MGTTLQASGLPPGVCADRWVSERPQAVAEVHRRFVRAGASVVRTATLCCRPDRDAEAVDRARRAVRLARSSGADSVWLSIGPGGPGRGDPSDLLPLLRVGADAVLLETFVDADEALEAVSTLAGRGVPVAVSMVPGDDGRMLDGSALPHDALQRAGAFAVGANCGHEAGDVVRAIERLPVGGPWLASPVAAGDLSGAVSRLRSMVPWLGGCCGVDPDRWSKCFP